MADALHGNTLEKLVTELVDAYGFAELRGARAAWREAMLAEHASVADSAAAIAARSSGFCDACFSAAYPISIGGHAAR